MNLEQHRNPKLTPVVIGAIVSVVFIAIFAILEKRLPGVMKLPEGWIILAVIPVIVGLFVGNYITSLKTPFGEIQRKLDVPAGVPTAVPGIDHQPDSAAVVTDQAAVTEMITEHDSFRRECRDITLVHAFVPAKSQGQKYDVFVFLSRHIQGQGKKNEAGNLDSIVQQADFIFGKSWGNTVFRPKIDGSPIGVRVLAWGSFWATCKVSFISGTPQSIYIHRYIDFESADLLK